MYRMRILYHTRMVHSYRTRMVCFSVPYAYGCTVWVYVSASMKLSIRTEDYIPNAYFSKAALKGFVSVIDSAL